MEKVEQYHQRKIINQRELDILSTHSSFIFDYSLKGYYEHKNKFYLYVGTLFSIDYYLEVDPPVDEFID